MTSTPQPPADGRPPVDPGHRARAFAASLLGELTGSGKVLEFTSVDAPSGPPREPADTLPAGPPLEPSLEPGPVPTLAPSVAPATLPDATAVSGSLPPVTPSGPTAVPELAATVVAPAPASEPVSVRPLTAPSVSIPTVAGPSSPAEASEPEAPVAPEPAPQVVQPVAEQPVAEQPVAEQAVAEQAVAADVAAPVAPQADAPVAAEPVAPRVEPAAPTQVRQAEPPAREQEPATRLRDAPREDVLSGTTTGSGQLATQQSASVPAAAPREQAGSTQDVRPAPFLYAAVAQHHTGPARATANGALDQAGQRISSRVDRALVRRAALITMEAASLLDACDTLDGRAEAVDRTWNGEHHSATEVREFEGAWGAFYDAQGALAQHVA